MTEAKKPDITESVAASNKRTTIKLLGVVVLMFGFAYALVPLYDVLCEVTGLNGRTSNTASAAIEVVDGGRTVTVEFITDTDDAMPWEFKPETRSVKVHPGEIKKVDFYARNNAQAAITGQAVPSVSPGIAASHLKKTQCFCFDQQELAGGEAVDMPVIFYIDPALPKHISTITLSYKLYNISADSKKTVSMN